MSHRYNPDLGPGRVIQTAGRKIVVEFPESGETLYLAANSDAIAPLVLAPGSQARLEDSGELVTVESCDDGHCRLVDGREVSLGELWPLPVAESLVDRLARGKIEAREDFLNRLDGLRLKRLREAQGLGSFLGGRIDLYPHQLHAAELACRNDPVRWLLADEVGLGKTVEACLIMNRLIHTGRSERTLVVAPATLTVQWLGELWRKYHQVFVLLDDKRLADVKREHGADLSPFDVYGRTIVSIELLSSDRRLAEQAAAAAIDLLVVDEAHHLRRPSGHPGEPAYRAIEPIAAAGCHVLLLTATPLEDDAHGFFRLLQLLRPQDFPEDESFSDRLARQEPLPPITSSTRRVDIGGLPPRRGRPIDLPDAAGWDELRQIEASIRRLPAENAVQRRKKADLLFRSLASPAALIARLGKNDDDTRATATAAQAVDPRIAWLAQEVIGWARAGEKTLIFVSHRETLDALRPELERRGRVRLGIFHEELTPERRDVEVAQFRLEDGPAVMISTECGGEGRNFQFCHRLVLFDLPWNPAVIEQRIGRLDRIGRTLPTEIVYFRPPAGLGRAVAELYEAIGLFAEPLGGLERELRHIAREVERVALDSSEDVTAAAFAEVLAEAREAHGRVQAAAYHELHRHRYHPEMGEKILARVPPELDELTESVVMRAAARFGFECEQQSSHRGWLVEFGSGALVDHLPGVAAGTRFLGTFDRETAVINESLDFFASGHPLVEGVLAELEDGPRGRVVLLQLPADEDVFGLLALYRRGDHIEPLAIDHKGKPRPEIAERLLAAASDSEHVDARRWTGQADWARGIRRLARGLADDEEPQALAAFRLRKKT